MLVHSQTQFLTQNGAAGGTLVVRDSTNLAPGINGTLSDNDNGPISVRIETIDYQTHTLTVTVSNQYIDLSAYTTLGAARLYVPKQIAPSNYVPVSGGEVTTNALHLENGTNTYDITVGTNDIQAILNVAASDYYQVAYASSTGQSHSFVSSPTIIQEEMRLNSRNRIQETIDSTVGYRRNVYVNNSAYAEFFDYGANSFTVNKLTGSYIIQMGSQIHQSFSGTTIAFGGGNGSAPGGVSLTGVPDPVNLYDAANRNFVLNTVAVTPNPLVVAPTTTTTYDTDWGAIATFAYLQPSIDLDATHIGILWEDGTDVLYSISSDGGVTADSTYTVTSYQGGGGMRPFGITKIGTTLFAWGRTYSGTTTQVCISTDDGQTWQQNPIAGVQFSIRGIFQMGAEYWAIGHGVFAGNDYAAYSKSSDGLTWGAITQFAGTLGLFPSQVTAVCKTVDTVNQEYLLVGIKNYQSTRTLVYYTFDPASASFSIGGGQISWPVADDIYQIIDAGNQSIWYLVGSGGGSGGSLVHYTGNPYDAGASPPSHAIVKTFAWSPTRMRVLSNGAMAVVGVSISMGFWLAMRHGNVWTEAEYVSQRPVVIPVNGFHEFDNSLYALIDAGGIEDTVTDYTFKFKDASLVFKTTNTESAIVSQNPLTLNGARLVRKVAVPLTATSLGQPGDFAVDGSNVYFCIADNSWVRAPVAVW